MEMGMEMGVRMGSENAWEMGSGFQDDKIKIREENRKWGQASKMTR